MLNGYPPEYAGELFDEEKGTLQSENNIEGDYNFITASGEWKTHYTYDHDCEAIVYAVQAAGSLGRSHYVKGKFIASNLCIILTVKQQSTYPINVQFYSFYLNSIRKQIVRELADGTSKLTISAKDLMNYDVEYIPIAQQEKIVQYYNTKIMPLQAMLSKEKEIFHERMNDLF